MFDSARVRGALRCYDAIDRVEDRAVVFLARSSLWVKSERSRRRQRLCSFIFFQYSSQFRQEFTSPFTWKETRGFKSNCPASGWHLQRPSGRPRNDWRHQCPVFFFGPFYKRVARGAFSLTLTCRTILPLSFGGDFQCIHVYPSSWARLEFVQMVIVKTFLPEDVENIAEEVAW